MEMMLAFIVGEIVGLTIALIIVFINLREE